MRARSCPEMFKKEAVPVSADDPYPVRKNKNINNKEKQPVLIIFIGFIVQYR
jgi:hypothetical protein